MNDPQRKHFVLECHRPRGVVHYIPIPRPSRAETHANPQAKTTDDHKQIFACPDCGYVSVYSESEIRFQISHKADPFEAGEYLLVLVEVGCDGTDCVAPKAVHTILHDDKGTWTQKADHKKWFFPNELLCPDRHRLIADWDNPKMVWEAIERLW